MNNRVDQSSATAQGDIVGGDKHTEVNLNLSSGAGRVEKLLRRLQQQIEENEEIQHTIDALARYHSKHPDDDISGLEEKLEAGGRQDDYIEAIRQKERFAMLLEKYSMYSMAQQIFAHFLAKTEVVFRTTIYPEISTKSIVEINTEINSKIIDPIVEECGDDDLFSMDYDLVYGMIYWLAEQCYVRWHK